MVMVLHGRASCVLIYITGKNRLFALWTSFSKWAILYLLSCLVTPNSHDTIFYFLCFMSRSYLHKSEFFPVCTGTKVPIKWVRFYELGNKTSETKMFGWFMLSSQTDWIYTLVRACHSATILVGVLHPFLHDTVLQEHVFAFSVKCLQR